MKDGTIDYTNYDLDGLYDAQAHIDSDRFPLNYANLCNEIEVRKKQKQAEPTTPTQRQLLSTYDDGVKAIVDLGKDGATNLRISISYCFVFEYQKNWVDLQLSPNEFIQFLASLKERAGSVHGHSDLWNASTIRIKPKHMESQQYRDIVIHRRYFILGAFWVPGALSGKMVRELLALQPRISKI